MLHTDPLLGLNSQMLDCPKSPNTEVEAREDVIVLLRGICLQELLKDILKAEPVRFLWRVLVF